MVTKKEAEFLKERAINFLKNGKYLLEKGILDIAAFNIEQFCQLYLKYKLLLRIGDFSKTHSLKELFGEFAEVVEKGKIKGFVERNISVIANLENAYITSRYIPMKFEESEVKEMVRFAKKFKSFIDGI